MKLLSEMTNDELWQLFPIVLEPYNVDWRQWYEEERAELVRLIGKENIGRISHIGSTAVEGLIAKPTVDILVELRRDCDTDALIQTMEQNSYIYSQQPQKPPPHMMLLKGYMPKGFAERVFHIHVRYMGDSDELCFRDYLRSHSDIAAQYGELKRSLKDKHEHDRDAYTEEKTEFVQRVTALAKKEQISKRQSNKNDGACAVGIIGGADGPTAVFVASGKNRERKRQWDVALEACKEIAVPVEHIKTGDELKNYLMETFGAEEIEPQQWQLDMLKINALMNHHPEALQMPELPDEKATQEEWLEWAKEKHLDYRESAKRLPDDVFGFRYAFLRIPHNEKTRIYYRARQKEDKMTGIKGLFYALKRYVKRQDEPEMMLDIELSTCHMSMGNGCARLINHLVLWRGITKEDIEQRTPLFMAYAAALRDKSKATKARDKASIQRLFLFFFLIFASI